MTDPELFVRAYQEFKRSVDFEKGGILPELDDLVWCMLMGVPAVPGDEDPSSEGPIIAVDQRVAILKAVFVEVNGDRTDEFLDQGLLRYDKAGEMTKRLLKEGGPG
jgi:hypothetical protein